MGAEEVLVIRNDVELTAMRECVASLEKILEALRKTARPEEWPALSSGYRLEMERMQGGQAVPCVFRAEILWEAGETASVMTKGCRRTLH